MVTYGITRFISTVSNKLSKDNLKILNHNLKTIIIHNHSHMLLRNIYNLIKNNSAITGRYRSILNSIYMNSSFENRILYGSVYDKEDIFNDLFHELFHMSSTVYDTKRFTIFSGFSQRNYEGIIGTAINEGYTEKLTLKFFQKRLPSYLYETFIIDLVEEIVGVKNLEKFYFNTDLESLVKELSKYSNEQDTIQFILDLDRNLENTNKNKLDEEIIKNINKYLTNIHKQKNTQDLKNGYINLDQYLKKMHDLFTKLQGCDKLLRLLVPTNYTKKEEKSNR